MPRTVPKGPGDNAYPRYQVADLYTTSIAVEKGKFYTMNNDGKLAVPTSSNFENGIFQATVSGGADGDRVACFAAGSRVIVKAKAGIGRGNIVGIERIGTGSEDEAEKLNASGLTFAASPTGVQVSALRNYLIQRVGRVFDFYGGIPDNDVTPDRLLTEPGDYIIVELGRA